MSPIPATKMGMAKITKVITAFPNLAIAQRIVGMETIVTATNAMSR